VLIADPATGQEVLSLPRPPGGTVRTLTFAPDGSRLALVDEESGRVELWDVRTGQQVLSLDSKRDPPFSLAFSPDGRRLAAAGPALVSIWDTQTGECLLGLRGPTPVDRGRPPDCRCLAFSPDGRRLAAAQEAAITLWNATSGQELLSLRNHTRDVVLLAFSKDGQRLLSADAGGVVKVWDSTTLTD
jgi:WD40 repeat protein